ncbi:MAG: cytochrome oxidase subunit III [Deltaproteobacteria bacterium]|nr:MAG: cytochrome oxidase subunit III [Deltaproteobacteria bacterium]
MMGKPIATTRTVMGVSTGKLAVWWLIVSEIVIFGGLLASYVMHRIGHPEWAASAAHTDVRIGGLNTMVLLTSSLMAVLAHAAAGRGDGPLAAKRLAVTIGFAVMFLCVKAYEWTTEISHGYTITASGFWQFYYVAAGIHAAHIIAGAIIMGFVMMQARRNHELGRVELIGLYWHFVDLVWIFLFPLLYIAK